MPTEPERVYLTHPVALDGDEKEGATGIPVVDTGTTLPVVVMRRAPSEGQFLVATAVGGRWVAELGISCIAEITVFGCRGFGFPGIKEVTVKVFTEKDGDELFSGETDELGHLKLDGIRCGTYYLTITGDVRFADYGAVTDLTKFTNVTLTTAADYSCGCCAKPFAKTLHISPPLGNEGGVLNWNGGGWQTKSFPQGTGYLLFPDCTLQVWISGRLCSNLVNRTRICSPLNMTYIGTGAGIPCSLLNGQTITITE